MEVGANSKLVAYSNKYGIRSGYGRVIGINFCARSMIVISQRNQR